MRLLEELALHVARCKGFIRPMMGYLGVSIDALAFRHVISKNNNLTFIVSKVHDAACTRASTPLNLSWVSILGGESGPAIA